MDKDKQEKTDMLEKDFEVSHFRPEDAEGIVRLFRNVYGEHYPIRLFYDPKAVVEANREGRYYSIVARRIASGEVVGATHLYLSAPCRSLYESGVGLVLKEYRNSGLNKRLLGFSFEEFIPRNLHIEEAFGEAVCNHPYTQKAIETFKFAETAIEVALMPAETYRKEKSAPGRVATLCAFRCYRPKPHRVFLPEPYQKELRAIYGRLDDARDFAVSDAEAPEGLSSRADMTVFDFAQVARIAVHEIGSDFREYFTDFEKKAIAQKAVVLQAWLDLTTPWVGGGVAELRKLGYFFGGALPRWFDGDGILMQKLLCPPDFESILLISDFSKQLLEVIKQDWRKTDHVI